MSDEVHNRPRRILCYGDSLTVGFYCGGLGFEPYGRSMAERLGDAGLAVEVNVCGLSGRTAEEMAAWIDGTLIDVVGLQGKGLNRTLQEDGPYDLVVIMAGTNDMALGANEDRILGNLRLLHSACHQRGVPTISLAPPPAPGKGIAREEARQHLVDLLEGFSHEMPGMVTCMDPSELMPSTQRHLWDEDGLHFSRVGSCVLGEGLAKLALHHVSIAGAAACDRSFGVEERGLKRLAGDAARPAPATASAASPPPRRRAGPSRCGSSVLAIDSRMAVHA